MLPLVNIGVSWIYVHNPSIADFDASCRAIQRPVGSTEVAIEPTQQADEEEALDHMYIPVDHMYIPVNNARREMDTMDPHMDITSMLLEWAMFPAQRRHAAAIRALAVKYNCLCGKWMIFASERSVDEVWSKVARAVVRGELGSTAKVGPPAPKLTGSARPAAQVICVYTYDFTDDVDVTRVRRRLRQLGFDRKLCYKPDAYTYLDIYRGNPWHIPPTIRVE